MIWERRLTKLDGWGFLKRHRLKASSHGPNWKWRAAGVRLLKWQGRNRCQGQNLGFRKMSNPPPPLSALEIHCLRGAIRDQCSSDKWIWGHSSHTDFFFETNQRLCRIACKIKKYSRCDGSMLPKYSSARCANLVNRILWNTYTSFTAHSFYVFIQDIIFVTNRYN